jgi:hypothetical protein
MAVLNNITFACEEPVRVAEFWREALGYEHLEVRTRSARPSRRTSPPESWIREAGRCS